MSDDDQGAPQPTPQEMLRQIGHIPGGRRFLSRQRLLALGVYIRGNRRNPLNQPPAAPPEEA